MCDRSNSPARSRTARCSSRIAAVLDRHQPAAELDHPRAERPRAGRSAGVTADRRVDRLGHRRDPPPVATRPARRRPELSDRRPPCATSARSVSNVSRRGASANGDPAHLVELVVVARPGRRRSAPSGSSGRSCGCASRDWTNQYSIESSGPVIRTSSPVSSATSRSAVSSVGLAGVRACPWAGSRSGRHARAGGCRRRAPVIRLVSDDDAAGGRGRRVPQARHGADGGAGVGPRARPRRAGPSCIDDERTRAAAQRRRDGAGVDRAPAGAEAHERARASRPCEHRRAGASRRRNVAGRSEAESTLPGAGRRAHESGRRPGRVLGGDAVLHGGMVPRQSARCKCSRAQLATPAPVSGRHAPRRAPNSRRRAAR